MSRWLIGAGVNGAMGVAMGAWAAHGAIAVLDPARIDWIKTGSSYQLWHAAALLGIAALYLRAPTRSLGLAGLCFCFGALAFSCSLYLLALSDWHWVIWLTPLGGAMMVAGWIVLILYGLVSGRGSLS